LTHAWCVEIRLSANRSKLFGLILVYTSIYGGKMNNFIANHTDQFANRHMSCDLPDKSDAAKSQTQLDAANVKLKLGRYEDEMIAINPEYFKRLVNAGNAQVFEQDIPPVESVFRLKSGARARLVDRSGSMVIVQVQEYRSDWIEWSEVEARIAAQ
jgi:hypothetical protein